MSTANHKMRRLMFFYCILIILFLPRAMWSGFLAYASSVPPSNCSDDNCDPCQPIPSLMYDWTLVTQELNALIYAFSSALLSIISVEFMLTAEEKRILRYGLEKASDNNVAQQVELTLQRQIGLAQLL
jgi:hypothetical protein